MMQSQQELKLKIAYSPHSAQLLFHNSPARFRAAACGARFGKTTMAINEAIKLAVSKPNSRGWVVAPTYQVGMEDIRKLMQYLPHNIVEKASLHTGYVKLINGAEFELKSAENEHSLVGAGLDWLIIDEADLVKNLVWDIYLRPRLTDRKGIGIFIGTPSTTRGTWFHDLFLKGNHPDWDDYESWQFPTFANPHIDPKEIEALRRDMSERAFRQQIMAEFPENLGAIFGRIDGCIREGMFKEPEVGKFYRMGVDLAKYQDFTVITVLDDTNDVVYWERFNQIDWNIQKVKIMEVAQKFNEAEVIVDATGVGDPIYEDFSKAGMSVKGFKISSHMVKVKLIDNLAIMIQNKEISYPKIPQLIDELLSFGTESRDTKELKYEAPPSKHDDCVISLALACWGLRPAFTQTGIRLSDLWGKDDTTGIPMGGI